jgi:hypothetical protein
MIYLRRTQTATTLRGIMDYTSVYYPRVRFTPDADPDPKLRRKKNIKAVSKILRPARHPIFPFIARFNNPGQCCVTGIRLETLGPDAFSARLIDADTMTPTEDGRTLFDEFFTDNLTGQPRAFTAFSRIDSGTPLRSSYSPELLQLYWLYSQWKEQEMMENINEESGSLWKRKGIKLIPMQKTSTDEPRPELVEQLEPFFQLCQKHEGKGVTTSQYSNPVSKEVDLVTITLDLRVMRIAESLSDKPPSEELP